MLLATTNITNVLRSTTTYSCPVERFSYYACVVDHQELDTPDSGVSFENLYLTIYYDA
jgi:hypothetical protein